jgi:hypothetical protein
MSHIPLSPTGGSQELPFNTQGLLLDSENKDPLSLLAFRPVSPWKEREERRTEYRTMADDGVHLQED